MKLKKTICVFCSANDVEKRYVDVAVKLARLMVANKYDLVWGGSNKGLMKVMADEVQKKGGKVIGITVEFLKNSRRINADEMIIAKDISARKSLLFKRSDAIILLVGGIGSLDEITELLELKKHNFHKHPIVILNTNNFYDGLKTQLKRMEKDGFLTKKVEEFLYFADSPKQTIEYMNKFFVEK